MTLEWSLLFWFIVFSLVLSFLLVAFGYCYVQVLQALPRWRAGGCMWNFGKFENTVHRWFWTLKGVGCKAHSGKVRWRRLWRRSRGRFGLTVVWQVMPGLWRLSQVIAVVIFMARSLECVWF